MRARGFSRLLYDCVSIEFSCGDLAQTVLIYTHLLQFWNNFLHPGFLSFPFFPCNFFSKSVIDNLFFNFPLFSGYWNHDVCVWTGDDISSSLQTLCFRMSIHLKALEICCDDRLLLQSKQIHIHTASDCNWVGLLNF